MSRVHEIIKKKEVELANMPQLKIKELYKKLRDVGFEPGVTSITSEFEVLEMPVSTIKDHLRFRLIFSEKPPVITVHSKLSEPFCYDVKEFGVDQLVEILLGLFEELVNKLYL